MKFERLHPQFQYDKFLLSIAAQSKEDSPPSSPRLNPFVTTAAVGDVADYHRAASLSHKRHAQLSTLLTYGSLLHYWRPVVPGHRKNMTNGAILDATQIFTVPVGVFLRVPFAGCYTVCDTQKWFIIGACVVQVLVLSTCS